MEEIPFETKTITEVSATPFFSSKTGIILIKGGTVVNSNTSFLADILIENGKITSVADNLEIVDGATVLDARDKYVIPGGIDASTHLYQGMASHDNEKETRSYMQILFRKKSITCIKIYNY